MLLTASYLIIRIQEKGRIDYFISTSFYNADKFMQNSKFIFICISMYQNNLKLFKFWNLNRS